MRLRDVVDEFHDDDGLADAGTAEHAALAALEQRADQVDHLDPGHENLGIDRLLDQRRGRAVDRRTHLRVRERDVLVHQIAGDIEDTAEDLLADRHRDRLAGVGQHHAALEAVGSRHGHRADPAVAKVLLHFEHQLGVDAEEVVRDFEGVVDARKLRCFREVGVNDGADDLDDGSLVAHGRRDQ